MSSKLQIVSSIVLLLGAANCHKDVKVTQTGPKCNVDSECATGSLCHPDAQDVPADLSGLSAARRFV